MHPDLRAAEPRQASSVVVVKVREHDGINVGDLDPGFRQAPLYFSASPTAVSIL
jgi:hypothetical protein